MAKPYDPKIFKYTIIQSEEDPLENVILKEGITVDFSVKDVRDNIIELNKKKAEIESMRKVEAAKMVNILRDKPEIEAIDDNLMKIYYIYQKAKSFCSGADEKLLEIEDAISEMQSDLKEISEQTGLDLSNVFTDVSITKVGKQEENNNEDAQNNN